MVDAHEGTGAQPQRARQTGNAHRVGLRAGAVDLFVHVVADGGVLGFFHGVPHQQAEEFRVEAGPDVLGVFKPVGYRIDHVFKSGHGGQLQLRAGVCADFLEALEFALDGAGVVAVALLQHGVEHDVALGVQRFLGDEGLRFAVQDRMVLHQRQDLAYDGNAEVLKHHDEVGDRQQKRRQVGVRIDGAGRDAREVPTAYGAAPGGCAGAWWRWTGCLAWLAWRKCSMRSPWLLETILSVSPHALKVRPRQSMVRSRQLF